MIKIEHTDVVGWDSAIRGMRNAMNSWDKSDSFRTCNHSGFPCQECIDYDGCNRLASYHIGQNDLALMQKLVQAGPDHSKFMRMLTVFCDITAPLYWWKEYDTYKVGTVANSCSTMHKIHDKEFTRDDFSWEHLFDDDRGAHSFYLDTLDVVIGALNDARTQYRRTKDKRYWWQMIQLLPSSYHQKRTVEVNYAVLRNMYHARKNHKLDEWHTFCEWVESLPYAKELITGE
jgi:hypothetical protein